MLVKILRREVIREYVASKSKRALIKLNKDAYILYYSSRRGSFCGKSAKNTMKRIDSSYIGVVQRFKPTSEPYMLVALDADKFNSLSIIV
jgi:hypothetical protein